MGANKQFGTYSLAYALEQCFSHCYILRQKYQN